MREPRGGLYEKAAGRLTSISVWFVFLLGSCVLLFVAINSLLFTSYYQSETRFAEVVFYKSDNIFLGLLAFVAAVALFCLLLRRRVWQRADPRLLEKALVVFILVAGSLWVLLCRAAPWSEASNLSNGALALMDRVEYEEWPRYFERFPYQLGFAGYLQIIYTIFGRENFVAVQLLNVIHTAVAYYALVQVTRLLFQNQQVTFVLTLLLFGTVYPVFHIPFAYGILPGLCFAMLALWACAAYLAAHRARHMAAMVACSAIACVLKNNYQVFTIAMCIVLAYNALRCKKWQPLLAVALLLAANRYSMLPVLAYYNHTMHLGLSLGGGVPLQAYIVMGLQDGSPMAPGWYNAYSYWIYEAAGWDVQAARQAIGLDLQQALARFAEDPRYAAEFFYLKTVSQWNEPTTGAFVATFRETTGPRSSLANAVFTGRYLSGLVNSYMDKYHLVLFGASFAGLVSSRKQLTVEKLLPFIIVLGGFLLHLAWEGKSQYMVQYFFVLTPYAALGLVRLNELLAAGGQWWRAKRKGQKQAA